MNRKHARLYSFFRLPVIAFCKLCFGYTYRKAKDLPENYIVVSNHTTDFDMLFVAASFPRQMYFVASEHITRMGLLSKVVKYAFAPIIRPKGTSAASTVMEMVRKARKGENVCLFAEGVRSWDGVTCHIVPSTGKLLRTAGCGLVTYKIVGGYFASPMWGGASIRRGYVHGEPVHVYTAEQLKAMTPAQIQRAIETDLFEDAYARQLETPKRYKGKNLAKGLENLLYICPECGTYDSFDSIGNTVKCMHCGMKFTYNEYGMLEHAPFPTVVEFSRWQNTRLQADVSNGVIYEAGKARLCTISDGEETLVAEGALNMSNDVLRCGAWQMPMARITDLAMHGQRAIVFTAEKQYYELIPEKGNNAFKFFRYYQLYKEKEKLTVG